MDAYLTIAEKILRRERRPLTAREILKEAYRLGQVPFHLHGQTQHKTLGARLSEDVLERRERSLFFRTGPGRFFLSEFLCDPSIPLEHRTQFVARRRRRQLPHKNALAFRYRDLGLNGGSDQAISRNKVLDLIAEGRFHYAASTKAVGEDEILVWSFVVVSRGGKTLTYRHGLYREDSDSFRQRRAIGFYTPVTEGDRTLFDLADHGITNSGLRNVTMDLGLSSVMLASSDGDVASLEFFVRAQDGQPNGSLLSVICFQAPEWFEPYARRLAINDLEWLDLNASINHVEDFDPWSRAVITAGMPPSGGNGR